MEGATHTPLAGASRGGAQETPPRGRAAGRLPSELPLPSPSAPPPAASARPPTYSQIPSTTAPPRAALSASSSLLQAPSLRQTARLVVGALRALPTSKLQAASAAAPVTSLHHLWTSTGRAGRVALYAAGLLPALLQALQTKDAVADANVAAALQLLLTVATTAPSSVACLVASGALGIVARMASGRHNAGVDDAVVAAALALLRRIFTTASPAATAQALWPRDAAAVIEAVAAHYASSAGLAIDAARWLAAAAPHVADAASLHAPMCRLLLPMAVLYLSRRELSVTVAALDAIEAFPLSGTHRAVGDVDAAPFRAAGGAAAVVAALRQPATFVPAARALAASMSRLALDNDYLQLGATSLLVDATRGAGESRTVAVAAVTTLAGALHLTAGWTTSPPHVLSLLRKALEPGPRPPSLARVATLCGLLRAAATGGGVRPAHVQTTIALLSAALKRLRHSVAIASAVMVTLTALQEAHPDAFVAARGSYDVEALVHTIAAHAGNEGVAVSCLALLASMLKHAAPTSKLHVKAINAGALPPLKKVFEVHGECSCEAVVAGAAVLVELLQKHRQLGKAAAAAGLVDRLITLFKVHQVQLTAKREDAASDVWQAHLAASEAAAGGLATLTHASREACEALLETPGALAALAAAQKAAGHFETPTVTSVAEIVNAVAHSGVAGAAAVLEAVGLGKPRPAPDPYSRVQGSYYYPRLVRDGGDALQLALLRALQLALLRAPLALLIVALSLLLITLALSLVVVIVTILRVFPPGSFVSMAALRALTVMVGRFKASTVAALMVCPGALGTLGGVMQAVARASGARRGALPVAAARVMTILLLAYTTRGPSAVRALVRQGALASVAACLQGGWAPAPLAMMWALALKVECAHDASMWTAIEAAGGLGPWEVEVVLPLHGGLHGPGCQCGRQ